ncbi:conserved hypothetical protein [Neospora caninum Liverpool]|uniref:Uncharacterized protein n=1 Tax=Neospora caninum (strain Liverpool) TaxID=572307 RepID=F0VJG5_NEOCL|nr:conserved hypothetical protein [Neospora caninum Liverpool]CBZ53876.1 conserved hypothetical protein [Neospora caninum Liverpool]|eukprot:XP_003883908.1 conserved hypothetical protein [Neospora caninum Liverpool]
MSSPPVGATGGVSPSAESSSPPPSGSSLDISELKRAAQRRLEALQAAASQSKALPSPLPSSLISASSAPGSSSFHSRTNHGLRTPAPPGSQGSMHSASFSPFPQPAFSHASDEAHAAKEMHAAAARKAAHEAMRVASLMLPKPKVEKQVLDENDTSFPEVQQLPNGLFSMDLAIATSPPASSASESCADAVASAATTVRPEAWPRLLKKETQQKIRERTGAAVLARGKPGGEGKKGLHLRITADKKATVLRGAICARDLLCSKQQLMFPPHVVVPSNFDAVAAMQGPDFDATGLSNSTSLLPRSSGSSAQAGANGSSLSDEPLNFAIFACTEDSLDKAVALIKWRLACVEEALRQHTDPDSFLHQKQAQKGELPKDAPQTALQPSATP